jgi:hypothetical protein
MAPMEINCEDDMCGKCWWCEFDMLSDGYGCNLFGVTLSSTDGAGVFRADKCKKAEQDAGGTK